MPAKKKQIRNGKKGRVSGQMHNVEAIKKAIEVCGGLHQDLASRVDVSQQQVSLWLSKQSIVTGERAVMIEIATNGEVSREEVRPDLFRPIESDDYEVDKGR